MKQYGLTKTACEQIRQILKRYPQVASAILYGSRAMGTYREGSDIDLTLTGPGLDIKTLHHISTDLDDLLLPYKIDLSIHEQLQQESIKDHIARVGVVFYERVSN